MCSSYSMMTSKVTPPTEEEGVEVDEMEHARGVVSVCGRFDQSWASLHLTNTTLMAPMMEK